MQNKLINILNFLSDNHKYNNELQIKFAKNSISCHKDRYDKLVTLLFDTLNTQSQPKINNIASFIQSVYNNKEKCSTFAGFFEFITNSEFDKNNNSPYEQLFDALLKQDGWGPKTSALLIKNIYNYHKCFNDNTLIIWDDVPDLELGDKIFLPVDAVILAIFNKQLSKDSKHKYNFYNINKLLHKHFSNKQLILFDDLWFLGFITQKGSITREFEWNENKYWTIKESNKESLCIDVIKDKAAEFLSLIEATK